MVPAALTGVAGVGMPGGLGTAAPLEPLPPVLGGGGGGEYTSARLGWGEPALELKMIAYVPSRAMLAGKQQVVSSKLAS